MERPMKKRRPIHARPLFAALGLAAALTLPSAATAASLSFYMDQSLALGDGVNYLRVDISDSLDAGRLGDIDIAVAVMEDALTPERLKAGSFGIQRLSFDYSGPGQISENQITRLSASDWKVSTEGNAGGGFGRFDFELKGTGSDRQQQLAFTISGIEHDTPEHYALGVMAQVAGFDADGTTNSAYVYGQYSDVPAVPIPAAVWMFATALLSIGALRRFGGRPKAALA